MFNDICADVRCMPIIQKQNRPFRWNLVYKELEPLSKNGIVDPAEYSSGEQCVSWGSTHEI